MNEAMALAAMTPVVGMNGPHNGGYIMNVTSYDKDLKDTNTFSGLTTTLDIDDDIYGLDQNGKVYSARKTDLLKAKDIVVEVYGIHKNDVSKSVSKLLYESMMNYNKRPIHKKHYIYEMVSGKKCYTDDQIEYDPMFEAIDLEKMSNGIQAVADSHMKKAYNLAKQGSKGSNYIPDNDFPQRTDELHSLSEETIYEDLYLLEQVSRTKFYRTGPLSLYHLIEGEE